MIAEHGSGEGWQRVEGADAAGGLTFLPLLVDCDDEARARRLSLDRQQPELANQAMLNWARYLRRAAKRSECGILDTSALALDQCISPLPGYSNL
jgi:hypothetical protein